MPDEPLNIDVRKSLVAKLPRASRYIPSCAIGWLARIIRQKELNTLLSDNADKRGVEFAEALLHDLGITLNLKNGNLLPHDGKSYIFACNHPLGGLDGIALIALLGHAYHGDLRVVVNDLLMQVHPLAGVFLPINKHGRQSRQAARSIEATLSGSTQILVFPAGLCSRMGKGGKIADLHWQKSFIRQSVDFHRDVIPLHFDGHNSTFFYRFAQLRNLLGIKANLEMALLPGELFKNKGKTFTVTCGERIPWQSFTSGEPLDYHAARVKQIIYNIPNCY